MVGPQRGEGRLETHVLFFVAAVAAGLINSLAGGGGLITFPLLTLVVPPVVADATSALALLPAYPSAVWRTRSKLRDVRRLWLWLLLVTSAIGGLVGALLLVWTGDQNFTFLVPWLVLGGTILFALEPWLSRFSGGAHQDRGLATALWPLAAVVVFVVALYGGHFRGGDGLFFVNCPEFAADGRRPPRRAFQEFARGLPQGRGSGRARVLRRDPLGIRRANGRRRSGRRLPRRCAHGQGKPHRSAFGGHDYWARLVGILLLDPLRPVGTIHHRRVNPTGFREAPRRGSVAVREVGAKGLFAVALTLITFREVEGQPAVWPDREEHRPCSRLSELRLDEALGSPLGQVPPGDGEHLLRGRRTVGPDDGALDGDVLVWELFALHRQAQHTRSLDVPGLAGLAALCFCKERDASARLVAVPDRCGMWWPVVADGDAQDPDVRLGEELLALLLGHPTGHMSSSKVASPILLRMVGSRARIHKCLPGGRGPRAREQVILSPRSFGAILLGVANAATGRERTRGARWSLPSQRTRSRSRGW